jgi:hypothetical protein
MKKIFTIIVFLFYASDLFSQTRILDSSLSWSAPKTLSLYFSDSLVAAVGIVAGTFYEGSDVLNATYTVGSNISMSDNIIVIPLTTVTPGEYYFDIQVTMSDASVKELQIKSTN